jgi:hypothetical protein
MKRLMVKPIPQRSAAPDLSPTGAGGKRRDARFLGQVNGRKNSDLLAEEETADDAESERRQKRHIQLIATPALAKAKIGSTRKAT